VLTRSHPRCQPRGFGCQDQDDPPRITGGYKLPPSSLLTRPDEQHAVNEEALKVLASLSRKNALSSMSTDR